MAMGLAAPSQQQRRSVGNCREKLRAGQLFSRLVLSRKGFAWVSCSVACSSRVQHLIHSRSLPTAAKEDSVGNCREKLRAVSLLLPRKIVAVETAGGQVFGQLTAINAGKRYMYIFSVILRHSASRIYSLYASRLPSDFVSLVCAKTEVNITDFVSLVCAKTESPLLNRSPCRLGRIENQKRAQVRGPHSNGAQQ
ncbi:hypothetical protein DFH08DRAFT_1011605 [Mycena albidolilacea]|uniref:Uncharacterized protein n=1 Tax=Mycena albidolilacea TaxID=1033008 RepID=A0AAD6ZWK7_9AGAR|nr:hypothetical protein DFH08DRAFT_1011605 [Mycena albidolilacea]